MACCAVSFSALPASAAQKPLTINLEKERQPISRYIYAQFIEHLGRCIYGGIWAEMLEDRKFYFSVTPEYDPYRASQGVDKDARFPVVGASPWEITGTTKSVTMVKNNSFVGEQTPLAADGSGIRQNDLAIVKGKRYEGYVWLKAQGKGATVSVGLSGATGKKRIKAKRAYKKYPFTFTATKSTDKASLSINVSGAACFVGTASLMPADNIKGMRTDTLKVLKELNAPMYRWPGGNFVSGYDWRDGIGDRDRRPPRRNPAWTGVEHNDFGLDEFIAFCRELNAEPLVVVNTGFGDAYSAAQEVEYCNASTDTIGGKWRAENGHAEPYNITWWGIGNEMFGKWQLGYMQINHYVLKHNRFDKKMRAVDPTIKTIGVGDLGGDWSKTMLGRCADHMDLISEHFYCWKPADNVNEHISLMRNEIKKKADAHRAYRKEIKALSGKDIKIAMDEWNYWYRPYVYGELGCIYRLRDALGIAGGFHEYYRNTDIIAMAHYAQTVNVIGAIKTTKTEAAFATTGLAQKLYCNHYGKIPVAVEGKRGNLDVAAALTEDKKALTVGIVNPYDTPQTISLKMTSGSLAAQGECWTITGPDPKAYNEPGEAPRVILAHKKAVDCTTITVAPVSVALYRIPLK